jgi:methionyl-tRNA synthetase
MVRNYCDGVIPAPGEADAELALQADDVREAVELAVALFDREFEEYNFSRAIEAISAARFRVDKFISDAKPWDLAKDPARRGELELVLHTAAESLRFFTAVLAPILPNATQAIWQQLGESGEVSGVVPDSLNWGDGRQKQIGEVTPIFPRLDRKKVMAEIKQDEAASQAARAQETKPEAAAEAKPAETASATTPTVAATTANAPTTAPEGIAYIGIEDFLKVELRAGQILTAEPVPKADKLLRFTIDLGEASPRQILAGIAQYYEADKLVGRKVIVVANLAPRKLRGFESQGMILAASIGEEGRPVLAGFLEEVPNGAKLK